jgi:molybdopterin molybdotransferase
VVVDMVQPRLKGFKVTAKVEVALEKFFDNVTITRLNYELVQIERAPGRVLAEDLVSQVNVPSYNRSAMDGYAVVAADTFGSSQTSPILLSLANQVDIGKYPTFQLRKGEAAEITTGAILPAGADAVVMLEYVRKTDMKQIEVQTSVIPGENVSKAGEDVRPGDLVLKQGTRLKPPDVAMLAELSMDKVRVVRKPIVAIVCSGNELVELGTPPSPGEILNTNRFLLLAMIEQLGASSNYLGIAKDSVEDICRLIRKGLAEADIVLVTGGTSVGGKDLVPDAVNVVGKPGMVVHGISIRPGMPTGLAAVNGKPIVLLSGQPVAAMIGFDVFVRPLVLRLLGTEDEPVAIVTARTSRRVASAAGMRTYLRVIVKEIDGAYVADPVTTTGSGILSSMTQANGIVVIPEDKEGIEMNEEVTVILFRPVGRTRRD